jgi:hypothetical protein
MSVVLLYAYLGGWVVTSILAVAISQRLRPAVDPAPHPRILALVAGAAWPVLVVALAQAGAVAVATEMLHRDETVLSYEG